MRRAAYDAKILQKVKNILLDARFRRSRAFQRERGRTHTIQHQKKEVKKVPKMREKKRRRKRERIFLKW